MCGGKPDNNPNPASNPVELPIRASTSASVAPPRPRTRDERPRTTHTSSGQRRNTSHRPESSTRRPPSEHKRTGSSSTHRPRTSEQQSRTGSSSTTRPPKSEHGGRRSASQRDHRKSRQFPAIQEYPEDRNIRREVAELGTFIDQHVTSSFYPLNKSGDSGRLGPEIDNPRSRHLAIRRYIAQNVINKLIMGDGESSPTEIAENIASNLRAYSTSNGDRLANLKEVCELGERLRLDMEEHPASWKFGSFDEGHSDRFVVLIPAVFRDGQQVIPSNRFRID